MEGICITKLKQKNKNTTNCIITLQLPISYDITYILKKYNFMKDIYPENCNEKMHTYFLLEGEFSMDIVLKYLLTKDMILTEEIFNQIIADQQLMNAKSIAYKYASQRPRTEKQIINKLKSKYFTANEIEKTIQFLITFNLIDDLEFTRKYIHDALLKKKKGKNILYLEILKQGVNTSTAKNAIKKFYPEENIIDMAIEIAQKKIIHIKHKPIDKQKHIIFNYLLNRGFDYEHIVEALNNITLGE